MLLETRAPGSRHATAVAQSLPEPSLPEPDPEPEVDDPESSPEPDGGGAIVIVGASVPSSPPTAAGCVAGATVASWLPELSLPLVVPECSWSAPSLPELPLLDDPSREDSPDPEPELPPLDPPESPAS
jgi:hypothetical protein